MIPDFLFNLHTPGDIEYDVETYPNVFTFRSHHDATGQRWNFEISFRRNDLWLLCRFIERCRDTGCRWVGFNNIYFDYPVVHFIYAHRNSFIGAPEIYRKAMEIIRSHKPFQHAIWESDHLVKQIDLFKIHHFDNKAKSTSLKVLEFNMQMDDIEDLPFDVGIELNSEQTDTLCVYNDHDVNATHLFHQRTKDAIKLRETLREQFGMNLINCNDVKIGEKILLHEMQKAGVECYEYVNGKKQRKQTVREEINLAEIVFQYVQFEREEFKRIFNFITSQTIRETNGIFKDLVSTVDGCEYKFGTGGLHMSVESQVVKSCERFQIVDVDVASYYPNLAIKNQIYPAHLGQQFCETLQNIFNIRKQYPKSDPRNGAFKLALNGVYGLSNNEYSPFLDAQYTMSITINGQLLLAMLVEQLIKAPGLRMIQANTDGVTYLCPREHIEWTRQVCRWWESVTNLELEEALYKRMFIRDVNNYIAEKEDGTLKRLGAYAHETAEDNPATRELPYHKDWSARVVQLAAEERLVRGGDISEFIVNHDNVYDFLLRTKVPRSSTLEWGAERVSNIVRYYLSTSGKPLEKVMPPAGPLGAYKRAPKVSDFTYNEVVTELAQQMQLDPFASHEELLPQLPHDERINTKNKSTYDERRTGIHTGWNVTLCNRMKGHDFSDINFQWYIKEAEKLCTLMGD